ncbi:MAG: type II secretion system protein GspH [Desulfobacteraceae bacterium]|nr:MAG: type II secretion system protein GspH [Desulfobacteraceae bacterium]
MQRGFTLIELLVVLVLISLITALVAPRMTSPLGNLQLKTAVKKVAGSLRYARSLAASEKENRVCVFDFENHKLTIFSESSPGRGNESAAPEGGRELSYVLPKGVTLKQAYAGETAVDSGMFQVVFFANGSSSGGDVVLAGENERMMMIHIDFITGMVEIAKSSSRE